MRILVFLLLFCSCTTPDTGEIKLPFNLEFYVVDFDEDKGIEIPSCSDSEPTHFYIQYSETFDNGGRTGAGYYPINEPIILPHNDEYLLRVLKVVDSERRPVYRMQRAATGSWVKIKNGKDVQVPVMCITIN